jgi:predicted nuclease of predicted toxin-antitoxin system
MKFKTDENLPIQAAELLRDAGYDALTVLEQGMGVKQIITSDASEFGNNHHLITKGRAKEWKKEAV